MTYPPGTRVRVAALDMTIDADGDASEKAVGGGYGYAIVIDADWIAANPDKVTVLLDEPADGGVVLDRFGGAWQRIVGHWYCATAGVDRCMWTALESKCGPLTPMKPAGGE